MSPLLALAAVALAAAVAVALAARRLALLGPPRGVAAAEEAVGEAIAGEAAAVRRHRPPWLDARLDREVATGLALTVGLLAIAAAFAVIGVLALLVRRSGTLVDLDAGVARWGAVRASSSERDVLHAITDLGDTYAVVIVGVAVAVVETWRTRRRLVLPFLLAVTIGNHLATTIAKGAMDRARPTFDPAAAALGPSFPSGHSSTAAAFWAAVALLLARRRPPLARALLAGAAAGIAVAVAASRVLLDVHWLSDVVAGLALGWAWCALCAIAFARGLGWHELPGGAATDAATRQPTSGAPRPV